eukprot:2184673-Pleurochrysis_carterae.AAC.4
MRVGVTSLCNAGWQVKLHGRPIALLVNCACTGLNNPYCHVARVAMRSQSHVKNCAADCTAHRSNRDGKWKVSLVTTIRASAPLHKGRCAEVPPTPTLPNA